MFLRYDGASCHEGVDLRCLGHAIQAIRQIHPDKDISQIQGWVLLQWEPQVGPGRIEIAGAPGIEVGIMAPAGFSRSHPFFLRTPVSVRLIPANPAFAPVHLEIDPDGCIAVSGPRPARTPTP